MRWWARGAARPLTVLSCAAAAATPSAQDILDRGTFIIRRGDQEIGRETFAITQVPGASGRATLLAAATVTYGGRELRPALTLAADGTPSGYQLEIAADGGARVVERLVARLARGRYSARLLTQQREAGREFRVGPGVVLVDEEIFHQYYFVPGPVGEEGHAFDLLIPRRGAAIHAEARSLGPDTVLLAGARLPAHHLLLRLADGEERHLWFALSGSLLQVTLPAAGVSAVRSAAPGR